MNEHLCTIVIPAYNAGVWIERTLESAAKQTYSNLEVLVIDDGSEDNTRELAESISKVDRRFRVISIPNGGVANARNIGIREARGVYIAFLDADDLWHPDKIKLQVEAMQQRIDGALPAACYALTRNIDVRDRVVNGGISQGESGYILARHLYFKFVGNGSSVLVCRDVALELGGYDPSWAARGIGGCEDLDFELKIAAIYPVVCVQHALVGYRTSPGNMSSNNVMMALGGFGVIESHLKANPQIPRWAARLIYGGVLGWSLPMLIGDRSWADALEHLRLLFINRPGQGVAFLFGKLINQPKRLIRLFREKAPENIGVLPLFTEVRPEIDPTEWNIRPLRDREILKILAELDARLWKANRGKIESETQHSTYTSAASSVL